MVSTEGRADILSAQSNLEPFRGELIRTALWPVRLRWLAGAVIIVGAAASHVAKITDQAPALVAIGVCVLVYNVFFSIAVRPGDEKQLTFQRAQAFWLIQILADIAALTAIVYYTGGIESPAAIFYIFHVVCAGILLPVGLAYLAATLATGFFGLVAVLQTVIPGLYHPLTLAFAGRHYDGWPFMGLELLAFATAMYTSVYVTTVISKRLQITEKQIIHGRNVLDSIISAMSEAVIFLSPDGKLLLRNPVALQWFWSGSDADDLAGERGGLPAEIKAYLEQAGTSSSVLPARTFIARTTGDEGRSLRQFRVYASGVFDETGQHLGYAIVAEDITEQRQLEHDLRVRNREILDMSKTLQKNEREMAQREKMVAIGTMAAGVAHEIGNPLACLSAVVQLLNRRQHLSEERQHLLTLQEQIERIAEIVRQLVEFARPARSEWVITDLDDLIEQTLKILRYSHRGRRARIESIRNRALPPVRIIPQQCQQVLINLLLNALDAVEGMPGEQLIRIERLAEDGWVKVMVKDNGCGMTEEHIRQAFEPFYTTKPPGKGTGLGLAVCYRLIEYHRGHISMTSTVGEGTIVTVSLPVYQKKIEGESSVAAAQPDVAGPLGGVNDGQHNPDRR